MNIHRSLFGIACRVAAFSFLMAGTASLVQAQQSPSAASTVKAPVLLASESARQTSPPSSSSSSSSSDWIPLQLPIPTPASTWLGRAGSSQPPPRRRYGRPNYSSGNTNTDGSAKYTFLAGMGLALPVGNTHKYETPSYGFQFGGGRNFNKVLRRRCCSSTTTTSACRAPRSPTRPTSTTTHCWTARQAQIAAGDSASPASTATITSGRSPSTPPSPFPPKVRGRLAVLGGGFYHKVTNFTEPTLEEELLLLLRRVPGECEHRPLHQQCSRCQRRLRPHLQVLQVLQRAVLHGSALRPTSPTQQRYGVTAANVPQPPSTLHRLQRLSRRTATAPPTFRSSSASASKPSAT